MVPTQPWMRAIVTTREGGSMTKSVLTTICTVAGLMAAQSLVAPVASGQDRAAGPGSATTTKARGTPKTPWGDPDLQGVWSGDSAQAIPMGRPAQFAGRAELSDEEYRTRVDRDKTSRKQSLNASGAFARDGAWLDRTFRQTSLIVEPADGVLPPLTPEAQAKRATAPRGTYGNGPLDGPEDFTFYDRCISLGAVGSLTPKIYGNAHRIVQAPGIVALTDEMIHETRIIPLDSRPHPGKKILSYMGDSRGHWEGDTLVVETTNFNGKVNYSGLGSTLVEKFTRMEPSLLVYEAIIDDPTTYTRRVRLSIPFTSPPGYQLLPYECHEGNSAVRQGLGGEREEDRKLAEDAAKGIFRPRRPIQGELGVGGNPIGQTPGARPAQQGETQQ
jgi:hypothetical protein